MLLNSEVVLKYIFPYRSAVLTRHASPSSKQTYHIKFTPIQYFQYFKFNILIKYQRSSRNTKIRGIFQSVSLPHMHKSPLPCTQRSTWFLCNVYAYLWYKTREFIIEIGRLAPKPLHSCIALLLGHIRYMWNSLGGMQLWVVLGVVLFPGWSQGWGLHCIVTGGHIQRSYFKTTHGTKKIWSYIAGAWS